MEYHMSSYFSQHHHPVQQKDGGIVPKNVIRLSGEKKSLKDYI